MSPGRTTRRSARLIYAASEQCADMLYATGFMAPDPFLWLHAGAEPVAVVSTLEIGRAMKQAHRSVRILGADAAAAAWGVTSRRRDAATLIQAFSHRHGIETWKVPAAFPLQLARQLQTRGIRTVPVQPFFPERACKNEAEIEHIADAVRLAEAGLERALTVLRAARVCGADAALSWNGARLTAETLQGEIAAAIARCGGTAAHTITAPGAQGADPHQCGTGPIRADTPVVIDIFPRVDSTGYHGDLTRTVVKGRAPDVVRRAYDAVRTAQRRAIAAVCAGAKPCHVHRAAVTALDDAGFATDLNAEPPRGFIHGTGHGLGLEIHEPPRVSKGVTKRLRAGNVVTIEPGLYDPDWGGVRLEDVVVVTADGCRNLTRAPFELELA